MKTIGIMGGMRWQASATYYRVINLEINKRLGGSHSAKLILDSLDFHPIDTAKSPEQRRQVGELLVESALRLERAGADELVIACNTVHRLAQPIVNAISIPLLHIADPAGQALANDGHKCVGLLGTRATMEGAFYKTRLARNFKLDVRVPDAATQASVDALVQNELAGTSPQSCAEPLDLVVSDLQKQGCTAVLLACTELGLAYGGGDSAVRTRELPLYDTAILHALAAVENSIGL